MNETVALFRTLAQAHVAVRPLHGIRGFEAVCNGCGWARDTRESAGEADIPLDALKRDANLHAIGCAEVPRSLWPGDQPMTGRW